MNHCVSSQLEAEATHRAITIANRVSVASTHNDTQMYTRLYLFFLCFVSGSLSDLPGERVQHVGRRRYCYVKDTGSDTFN